MIQIKKFILNCANDKQILSRTQIIKKSFLWLLSLLGIAVAIRVACFASYMVNHINPEELTKFGGDPTTHIGRSMVKTLLTLLIVAPVLEETIFRLPLSFKRKTVALWITLLPSMIAFYFYQCTLWYILLLLAVAGSGLYVLIYNLTTDKQWGAWRTSYVTLSMWISAISFGLIHLMAFSVLNLRVFPFALATILIPMAGGVAITYLRVNLGFWYGVALHMLFNLPGVIVFVASSAAFQ